MVAALCKEVVLQKDYLHTEEITSIYFGGGTPSLLTVDECSLLLHTLHQGFKVRTDAEITLEANPDDITVEKLRGWKAAGINRLSIGVQSFVEAELTWMNRAHNHNQAVESLGLATAHFDNITLDLIYGSPLLTNEMWQENVYKALELRIPHLSCYALTVEEKTPLHKHIKLKQKQAVDEDKQAGQFLALMDWMRTAGYEHYEISNFAKPGYRSKHNSSYWKGTKYLGIGPSAHSYNGTNRQWNVANNRQYIDAIQLNLVPAEMETLSATDRLNEYIMISLRTREGINLRYIEDGWGREIKQTISNGVVPYLSRGLLKPTLTGVQLTDKGMVMADGIAAQLFNTQGS